MNKLKPCPFCGKAEGLSRFKEFFDFVSCANCGISVPLELWNNRPHEKSVKVQAIKEAIQHCVNQYPNGAIHSLNEIADKLERGE